MTSIYSSNQTHLLAHQFIEPTDIAPIATLLIAHGMAEHSGRYVDFAQFLADHGIAVAIYDHVGHGNTAKTHDELGFIDKQHPIQTLQKDLILMADALKARHPDVPHFVMGHSMGSFLLRDALTYHASDFAGAILMGTAGKNPLARLLVPALNVCNHLASDRRNEWLGKTMNAILNQPLGNAISASRFAWLSEDPEAVQAYENDPQCGFTFTNNGFLTVFALMNRAVNQAWYQPIRRDFPLLLVSGVNDPIGDMGKGIEQLSAQLRKQNFSDLSQYLYPNMRHEPLHEQHHELVYQDLLAWLLMRAKRCQTAQN